MVSDAIDPFDSSTPSPLILAVSFQHAGHLYSYLTGGLSLQRGDRVLVEGENGPRIGVIEIEPQEAAMTLDLSALRPVVRLVNDRDLRVEEDTLSREYHAERLCAQRIRERGIAMKLVKAEYTYDGRKALFYFV